MRSRCTVTTTSPVAGVSATAAAPAVSVTVYGSASASSGGPNGASVSSMEAGSRTGSAVAGRMAGLHVPETARAITRAGRQREADAVACGECLRDVVKHDLDAILTTNTGMQPMPVAMRQVEQPIRHMRRRAVGAQHPRAAPAIMADGLSDESSSVTTGAPNISTRSASGLVSSRPSAHRSLVGRQFAGQTIGAPFAEGGWSTG